MRLFSPEKLWSRAVTYTWTVVLLAGFVAAGTSQLHAEPGLPNFGQVSKTLFRGAQPSEDGFRSLQHMGITIVVNFRNDDEATREKAAVEALGMKYVAIPWSGRQNPSTPQVVQFLDLVRDNPQAKIFVHCQRGADRTGTMVAAYRIVVEQASTKDAVGEMLRYHYAHFWLPQLERYVVSIPQLLKTDSSLSAYATGLPVPSPTRSAIATIVPVTP